MKKRVFIAMHYMEIGGAEISLIGLLQALDYSKYDVDLFIYSHQGELMQFIPKKVNVLPESPAYSHIEKPMKEALLHGQFGVLAARLWAKWQFRKYLKRTGKAESAAVFQYIGNAVTRVLPSLFKYGEYDLAISFLTPHNIVLEKVKAKRKACWIHTDYSTIDVNAELELPVWSRFDHIVAISEKARRAFLKIFPSLEPKTMVMENILSSDFVRQRADMISQNEVEKEMPRETNIIRLLSVGRFSEAKNYDNVPDICKRVNDNLNANQSSQTADLKVKWYIIGWGGDEALIRQKIAEAGMQDYVIIFGKRTNPYPYIKACDLYVQPSRYEGKSVTVREAQMLCNPVVVTNYPTASSQIQDGIDGVIVPMDNENCASGIVAFILDEQKKKKIVEYLQSHDYGNMAEVEKIEKLIG